MRYGVSWTWLTRTAIAPYGSWLCIRACVEAKYWGYGGRIWTWTMPSCACDKAWYRAEVCSASGAQDEQQPTHHRAGRSVRGHPEGASQSTDGAASENGSALARSGPGVRHRPGHAPAIPQTSIATVSRSSS